MSKNVFKITRKELKKVIKESLEKALSASNNSIHLFEMATIGAQKWGKDTYSIQIHGASTADRPVPHIHIYKYNDNTKNQFNFEISLIDLVSKDQITLVRQLDREKNINHKNRDKCSWRGYNDIYNGLRSYLFGEVQSRLYKGICVDNLDAAIYAWNQETDMLKTNDGGNPMKEWLDAHGIQILPEYQKYFEPKRIKKMKPPNILTVLFYF